MKPYFRRVMDAGNTRHSALYAFAWLLDITPSLTCGYSEQTCAANCFSSFISK